MSNIPPKEPNSQPKEPQKIPPWGLVLAVIAGIAVTIITNDGSGFSFANFFMAMFVGSLVAFLSAKFAASRENKS